MPDRSGVERLERLSFIFSALLAAVLSPLQPVFHAGGDYATRKFDLRDVPITTGLTMTDLQFHSTGAVRGREVAENQVDR
jgi:hypothetical protein